MRSGEKEAASEAETALEKALAIAPEDPMVLTYHGSLLVLKGRDAKLPFRKMQLANSGLAKMENAVRLAPEDVEIRMQRALHCLGVPPIFNRADTAVVDFSYLLRLAEKHPRMIPEKMQASIMLELAEAYMVVRKPSEAERLLSHIVEQFAGSDGAAKAAGMLEEISGETKSSKE